MIRSGYVSGLGLELGLGKLRNHRGGPGGLPPGFGSGKSRYHTGGPGGLPPGFGFGLGKLRYHTGGPGGLPPGFGLGKFRYHTGGPGAFSYLRILKFQGLKILGSENFRVLVWFKVKYFENFTV